MWYLGTTYMHTHNKENQFEIDTHCLSIALNLQQPKKNDWLQENIMIMSDSKSYLEDDFAASIK